MKILNFLKIIMRELNLKLNTKVCEQLLDAMAGLVILSRKLLS